MFAAFADRIVLYRGERVVCRVVMRCGVIWCGMWGSPKVPVRLVSMLLCLYRTSRVYRLCVGLWSWLSACLVSVCCRDRQRVRSIGVTSSLFRRPRCGPLFLCPSLPVWICSPPRPCTAHPPSHVYTANGNWPGFGVALVEEDAGGQGGNRDVVRGRLGPGVDVRGKRGGSSHVGRREGPTEASKVSRLSPRLSCSDCGVLPGTGCCMCCNVCVCVCLMCVCNASRRHLPTRTLRRSPTMCASVVCVASGHWHHFSLGRQPAIRCCVAVGVGGTLISSCRSSCGGACGRGRACGGGLHCSWVQIRNREPR